jgi:hypothetical protein
VGAKLIACTIAPNATNINGTAARKAIYNQVNYYIKQYCQQNDGCFCFDLAEALTDPTNGNELSSVYSDSIHPNGYGAQLIGNWAYTALNSVIPNSPIQLGSFLDARSATWTAGNILANGRMAGTGGANSGTGISGTVADSWRHELNFGTAVSVASKVARTDGVQGFWQQMAVASFTSGAVALRQFATVGANVIQVGDVCFGQAEIAIDATTTVDYLYLMVDCQDSGFSSIATFAHGLNTTGGKVQTTSQPIVFRTPDFTVPALTANVKFLVLASGAAGACTFRVGRTELRKIG